MAIAWLIMCGAKKRRKRQNQVHNGRATFGAKFLRAFLVSPLTAHSVAWEQCRHHLTNPHYAMGVALAYKESAKW